MHGNKAAAITFSCQIEKIISDSIVHGFKKAYFVELKKVRDPDCIEKFHHGNHGYPLLT